LNIPFYNNYGGLDLNTPAKPLNHEMEINRTAAKFKPFCYFNE
jgi:hypothetical protein